MTSTDPHLHDLLERAVRHLDARTPQLLEGSLREGRRLRRRRRAGTGLLAALAVVAVGVPLSTGGVEPTRGVPATSPSTSPPASPDSSLSTSRGSATPTPGTDAAAEPGRFVSRPGWWDMPIGAMRTRLEALLPDGVSLASMDLRTTDPAPGEPTRRVGHLTGRLADRGGDPTSVEVMLLELPQDPDVRADQLRVDLSCDLSGWEFQDLQGSVHCANQGPDTRQVSYTDQGVSYHEVRRRVGDGEIYVAVANSVQRKWGPPASAERPALRLEQLASIAAADAWTAWAPTRR